MALVALTTFITVADANGTVQYRFQNSQPGQTISLNGASHSFLSFLYSGAGKNRSGDNLEAELVLASNQLSMSYAVAAVQGKWTVTVTGCSMNPSTFAVARTLTTETWLAAGMSYDPERINVMLSSGIDAVGASAPTRVLTTHLVGALPLTAQISNR